MGGLGNCLGSSSPSTPGHTHRALGARCGAAWTFCRRDIEAILHRIRDGLDWSPRLPKVLWTVDFVFGTAGRRWLFTLATFALATGLNFVLQPLVGERVPFLVYFPALVAVGLYAGAWPGVLLLLAAIVVVQTFWVAPFGAFWPIAKLSDAIALLLFAAAGGLILSTAVWAKSLLKTTREAMKSLQLAMKTGKMATWRWDLDTDELTFSDGAKEVLGLSELPRYMRDGWPLVHSDDRDGARSDVETAVATGKDFTELTRIGETETPHWVLTHGQVTGTAGGKSRRVAAVMVDVTEQQEALIASRAAEQRLRQEVQRKDTFLATLSHELRNPMAPIRYAIALLGDKASPAQHKMAKEVITRQSEHMARLLDDLLDMSRITRNAIELRREIIDLREVTRAAIDNAAPGVVHSKHRLQTSEPADPVYVNGDPTRLQQIVGNLLDNALKYSDPGTDVDVRIELEDNEAVVHVRDRGLGIDPQSHGEIFELFTQLRRPGQGKGGLGIGLAVVKQLVELHGGTTHVQSEGLGKGSVFTVRLPRAAGGPATQLRGTGNVIAMSGGPRVLIVDDNTDTADVLAMCVRQNGYSASVAYTGFAALDVAGTLRPEFVLLDLGLPDLHGHEVARRIRGMPGGQHVRIAAITGWGQPTDRSATKEAGFDMHFVKPVDPDDLLAWLQRRAGSDEASIG